MRISVVWVKRYDLYRKTKDGLILIGNEPMRQRRQLTWEDYRKRRRLMIIALVGYLPVMIATSLVCWWLLSTADCDYVAIVALTWLAFFGFTVIRLNQFPCPNCGRAFFLYKYHIGSNPLAKRCLHCDWPKWAVPGDADKQEETKPDMEN